MAVIVPKMISFNVNAEVRTIASNFKVIEQAIEWYYYDTGQLPPVPSNGDALYGRIGDVGYSIAIMVSDLGTSRERVVLNGLDELIDNGNGTGWSSGCGQICGGNYEFIYGVR